MDPRSERSAVTLAMVCVLGLLSLSFATGARSLLVKAYACQNRPCTKTAVISLPDRNSRHNVDVYVPLRRQHRKLQVMLFRDGEPETAEPLERQLDGRTDLPVYSWTFRGLGEGQYLAAAQIVSADHSIQSATARFYVGVPPSPADGQ